MVALLMSPIEVWKSSRIHAYQEITCHLIFDIKMDFIPKAQFVANGATTETPTSLTYSSVISRDSVKIAVVLAALKILM
ncbi:hypothetical protein ACHAXS_010802 [Conticribra weissflogii]